MVRFDENAVSKGSKYVNDRRGRRGRRSSGGGGGSLGKAGGGIGGIILAIIGVLFGIPALTGDSGGGGSFGIESPAGFDSADPVDVGGQSAVDPDQEVVDYLGALMGDTQDVWSEYFDQAGLTYQFTTLQIFEGQVNTGCGPATSAVGPFYCPAPGDNSVYIDLSFLDDLRNQFGAPGDFAIAYVVAHEVGHHIQSVAGISDQVRQAQASDPSVKNELSVRQELQADCLAGVWAWSANRRTNSDGTKIIEIGDLEEGLRAAEAVGDDSIAEMMGGQDNPHNYTHGTSDARQTWFLRGFETGDPEQCDTYTVSRSDVGL